MTLPPARPGPPMRGTRVGVLVLLILSGLAVYGLALAAAITYDQVLAGRLVLSPSETWSVVRLAAAAGPLVLMALVRVVAVWGVASDAHWGGRIGLASVVATVILAAGTIGLSLDGRDPIAPLGTVGGLALGLWFLGIDGLAALGLGRLAGRARATTRVRSGASSRLVHPASGPRRASDGVPAPA